MSSPVQVVDHLGGAEFHVTDARWSVLTDDDDQAGAVSLRIVSHNEDIDDAGDGMRLLFTAEQALVLVAQLRVDVLPYYASLAEGNDDGD